MDVPLVGTSAAETAAGLAVQMVGSKVAGLAGRMVVRSGAKMAASWVA
jgi:hypothetical protein